MSVNLQKGQKISLTKGGTGLKKVMVGLGWDEAQPQAKGFFGSLFAAKPADIDCDALEDAILITFLNLIGFDVVLFVPTGYQTIERYLNDNYPIEHQIGEYLYDLQIPDFSTLPQPKSRSWLDHILKRGN